VKIIFGTPYIYSKKVKRGTVNTSGLAFGPLKIAEKYGELGHSVFIITQSQYGKETKLGLNCWMKKKTIFDIIKSLNITYIRAAITLIKKMKVNVKTALRILLYFANGAYFERSIKQVSPDAVNIHSVGLYTIPFIMACVRTKTKFLVTQHGTDQYEIREGNIYRTLDRETCEMLRLLCENDVRMSMISTGSKLWLESFIGRPLNNISIIVNPISLVPEEFTPIDHVEKKYIISTGRIGERKNQIQSVRAYELLPEYLKKQYSLVFVGGGVEGSEAKKYVDDKKVSGVIFTDFISKSELLSYYNKSKIVVVASLLEGFGMSMLEGYAFGIPVVAFADLDAIPDVYSEEAMIKVEERTDEALSKSIQYALEKDWDPKAIRSNINKFTLNKIGKQYIEELKISTISNLQESDLFDYFRNKK